MSLDVAGRNAQVEGLTSRIAEVSLHGEDGAELSGGGYERQVPSWSQARGGVQAAEPTAVAVANRRALITKAQAALTTNATYLALAAPTTAQNTAQIKALTREVNALIRLLTKALDSASGTWPCPCCCCSSGVRRKPRAQTQHSPRPGP